MVQETKEFLVKKKVFSKNKTKNKKIVYCIIIYETKLTILV